MDVLSASKREGRVTPSASAPGQCPKHGAPYPGRTPLPAAAGQRTAGRPEAARIFSGGRPRPLGLGCSRQWRPRPPRVLRAGVAAPDRKSDCRVTGPLCLSAPGPKAG